MYYVPPQPGEGGGARVGDDLTDLRAEGERKRERWRATTSPLT